MQYARDLWSDFLLSPNKNFASKTVFCTLETMASVTPKVEFLDKKKVENLGYKPVLLVQAD